MSLIRGLTSGILGNITSSLMGESFINPFIEPSLIIDSTTFSDGFTKEQLVDVDGSGFVADFKAINGANINFTQSIQTNKPQYIDGIINGRPGIRFDAINDFLESALLDTTVIFPNDQEMTVFIVQKLFNNGGLGIIIIYQDVSTVSGRRLGIFTPSNSFRYDSGGTAFNAADITDKPHILTATKDASNNLKTYVDGTSWATNSGIATVEFIKKMYIGALNGTALFGQVDIGEILVYNRIFSDSERNIMINNYLKPKWGI